MSRKHFVETASIVAGIPVAAERKRVAERFATMFASANPRFNRARFLVACGVED